MHSLSSRESLSQYWREVPLFSALVVILFCLPLPLGANREWAWSLFEAMIFLSMAIWIYGFLNKGYKLTESFIRAKWILVSLCILVLWQLVQIIPVPMLVLKWISPQAWYHYGQLSGTTDSSLVTISLDTYATWQSALLTMAYTGLLALLLLLAEDRQKIKVVLYTLFFAGFIQAVLAGIFLIGFLEGTYAGGSAGQAQFATGSFVNRNHLAGFLELTIASGIGLMLTKLSFQKPGNVRQWLIWFGSVIMENKTRIRLLIVIMVITLVLTRSRMGNMAFFMSFFSVSVLYIYATIRQQGKANGLIKPAMILLISMLVIDLIIVGNWFGMDRIVERVGNTSVVEESRADVFADTLQMSEKYWLTGVGGGAFASSFIPYQSGSYKELYDHVHNDYLEFIVELGLPAFLLLPVIAVLGLASAVKVLLYSESRLYRGTAYASLLGMIAILIHSLVDFNLRIPSNAAYFIVLLGLGIIVRSLDHRSNPDY